MVRLRLLPPNLARLIASLGQYLCAADSEAVYVNLYVAGTTTLDVGGQSVTVEQQTGYPYSGEICLTLSSGDYGLCLRLPEWADRYELSGSTASLCAPHLPKASCGWTGHGRMGTPFRSPLK